MKGQISKSLEALEFIHEKATGPEYFFNRGRWKARLFAALGELWLGEGDVRKAQNYHDAMIADGWTDKYPFKKYQVRARRLNGNVLAAQGKDKKAESELKKALRLARELGNPTQLWRTRQSLGDLYSKQGRSQQAATQYHGALKVVKEVVDGLTDPELKEGFLNSAPIRELFNLAEQG